MAAEPGAQPAVVSWSVIATTSSPAFAAAATSPAGESVPSEAVEWACRSMRIASIVDDALGHTRGGTPRRASANRLLAAGGALGLDHGEAFGLLLLVAEDQLRDRVVELFGPRQEVDLVERLDLTGRLDHHRAVAHHAAGGGAHVAEVR